MTMSVFSTINAPSMVVASPRVARAVTPPITASTTKLPTVGLAIRRGPDRWISNVKNRYSTTDEAITPSAPLQEMPTKSRHTMFQSIICPLWRDAAGGTPAHPPTTVYP